MEKLDLPKINKDIASFWKKNDTFKKSLEASKNKPPFIFFDGPPFATGLPHYGHLLASTIKDIVPRYKTQTGSYVQRLWGWDCHGLPIEHQIDEKYGIKTRQQVLDMTVAKYNEACKDIVLHYDKEWQNTIEMLGRWVDYKNNWKTMDKPYMESVWWVFKQLYQKGLIYHGFKVMPYSTGCRTPLSNSEASLNYQNVPCHSLTLAFQLTQESVSKLNIIECKKNPIHVLVWTTTPWTVPSNIAVCLSPKLTYVLIKHDNKYYVIAKECLERYFKKDQPKILHEFKNHDLVDLKYVPLYDFFTKDFPNAFKLVFDNYVSSEKGTGAVHIAPAFGEDDYRLCSEKKLVSKNQPPPCPIDLDGCFSKVIGQYEGKYIKDCESLIIKELKKQGRVFRADTMNHEYPHCWRSNKPLIYMAVPSWFLNAEKLNNQLLEQNKKINWMPEAIGSGRFDNWLSSARDWCISRNRFWGATIPLWTNDDMTEFVCIESVEQLESYAKLKPGSITDLHTHAIDHITIPAPSGKGTLKRIPEVFDCWFESGCMPYGHCHYMGDEKTPIPHANFIAEGLDQTRGWFYSLHVIAVALFGKPAFDNVIVNGLILAEDGKKMSKSLKNYPSTEKIFETYGADALRMYLINSDVVLADPLKFSEKDLKNLVQTFFIPYHNSLNFLVEMTKYYETIHSSKYLPPKNLNNHVKLDCLDRLMLFYTHNLIKQIHSDMGKYKLDKITDYFVSFIDKISRMYIKIKKTEIKNIKTMESYVSLSVLYHCLYTMNLMLTPFAPFITEHYYHNFYMGKSNNQETSIHLMQLPTQLCDLVDVDMDILNDPKLVESSKHFLTLLDMGRSIRDKLPFSYKRPVKIITVHHPNQKVHDQLAQYKDYLLTELNALDISYEQKYFDNDDAVINPNFKKLAQAGHKNVLKNLTAHVKEKSKDSYQQLLKNKYIEFNSVKYGEEFFTLEKTKQKTDNTSACGEFTMIVNTDFDEEIEYKYELRKMVREINQYRKLNNLSISDITKSLYFVVNPTDKFKTHFDNMKKDLQLKTNTVFNESTNNSEVIVDENGTFETYGTTIKVMFLAN